MRVVAGTARGRHLVTPKGRAVRPTSDRVREALFNIIADRVDGARVLDLFCGSGALAVEALSRGAAAATLVDSSLAALAAARDNMERAGVAARATIVRADAARWAGPQGRVEAPFDLVFLDPPYATPLDSVGRVVARVVAGGLLVPGGLVVVERPASEKEPAEVGPLPVAGTRRYGATRLLMLSETIE